MNKTVFNSIPISVSLNSNLEGEAIKPKPVKDKKRLFVISVLAIGIAAITSLIAKLLIYLIDLVVNISFYGRFSIADASPADNTLGLWVIIIPAIGGIIVGLMALYGSKAIRGHGIPEAMEQILVNQSKIKPTITYLKPLSSAISIGTGGPFGAEGPIIATGGALGSTIGQVLKISHNERKVLLASGATAGMSAIFGSPIAAIFLAIELLLFEFSPRTIIPVALACITGAAGHYFLFDAHPVFEITRSIGIVTNTSLFTYSIIGLLIGVLSVGVTKIVYLIEDGFEKLPIHWMWWPAIGGLAVGIIGYFSPRTLGVGYNNITDVLNGGLAINVIATLCILKFTSWAIALGSGTSGGTLAPLLTIGGAAGAILGSIALYFFPSSGVTLPLAALVGMAAMFAGASRAFITSIIFAVETTGQSGALLPLLATCSASYIVSFFLMENTIMTEKISRRGVKLPSAYEPNLLEQVAVNQVMDKNGIIVSTNNTVEQIKDWLDEEPEYKTNYFIVCDPDGAYSGIVNAADLYNSINRPETSIKDLISLGTAPIKGTASLQTAIERMAKDNIDVLPVLAPDDHFIEGILSYKNILSSYKIRLEDNQQKSPSISLKRKRLEMLVHGKRIRKMVKGSR
ncbi:chloride channel protein [Niabella ginsenosidivorans]|uniref:Chloride channel protein n=1 Tax=Niabella ginsenosidivorans TaxID=1176587 RepID=A0A1A9I799_9BACT|nr:chloride channel protein [Niabella ginsenosidivorans]ANH82580.1 chloride channel protein [Niabella ginsenosidivorans]